MPRRGAVLYILLVVLAAGGGIGGFSAPTGIALKRKLLAIESIHARGTPNLFDSLRQAS